MPPVSEPSKISLETERLRFRRFDASDFDRMRTLESDPLVMRYLGNGQVRTEEQTRASMERLFQAYAKYGQGLYATEFKETGEFAGRTGLIPWTIDGELMWEVGYTLSLKHWGKGLATEAARFWVGWGRANLFVSFLISLIHPDNRASKRVAQKAGMHFWATKDLNGLSLDAYRIDIR